MRCLRDNFGLMLVVRTVFQRVPNPVFAPQLAVFQFRHFHAFPMLASNRPNRIDALENTRLEQLTVSGQRCGCFPEMTIVSEV